MFRCTLCKELYSWDMLVIWHELNHCPKCNSLMLTTEKKQKELRTTRPEPEDDFDKDEKVEHYPKVVKTRSKHHK